MEHDQCSELRDRIKKEAAGYAEANVYSLNNPYLSQDDKVEVELWFQFPGNVSLVTMLACLVYSSYEPLSWYWIIGIPLAANCVFGILNWVLYSKKLLLGIYLTVFHNLVLWLLTIVAVVLLTLNGAYGKGILAFILKLFLIVFFEPHIMIYAILSGKYGMHPKYVFFKRLYQYQFPFEEDMKKEII